MLLLGMGATAQEFNRHECSLSLGGGVSSLQTKPAEGSNLWSYTCKVGLGYHFFFNPRWAIATGADFVLYNGGISMDSYSQKQPTARAATGTPFDFLVSSSDYKEPLQAMMITIPLMAQYQATIAEKLPLYAALGLKVGIPVSATEKSEGSYTTKGYFPNLNVTYEDMPEYGFVSNQSFPENQTDLSLKAAFMLSAELGARWSLPQSMSLYTGIYADYGLNNLLDKEAAPANTNLVVYRPGTPTAFTYHTAADLYAEKLALFAVGVTLRLTFWMHK